MTTRDEDGSADRPTGEPPLGETGEPPGERRRPTAPRQQSALAGDPGGPGTSAGASVATIPGLVVTEERLPDGRAITYFEVPR